MTQLELTDLAGQYRIVYDIIRDHPGGIKTNDLRKEADKYYVGDPDKIARILRQRCLVSSYKVANEFKGHPALVVWRPV